MHCVNTRNIVYLYSFKSIMIVTVIVHSLPFHSHFLVTSIHLSDGVENFNKTIHFKSFSILDHTKCNLVLNFSTALLWATSAMYSICPRKVSSNTVGLGKCITVLIVNSIKINVKACMVMVPMI